MSSVAGQVGVDKPGLTDNDFKLLRRLASAKTVNEVVPPSDNEIIEPVNLEDDVPDTRGIHKPWSITTVFCRLMRSSHHDGISIQELSNTLHVSRSTIEYHLLDKCHHITDGVDPTRCAVIRELAYDGFKYQEIADRISGASRQSARYHAVGECTCKHTIPPVGIRQPGIKHICKHCGIEFPSNGNGNTYCSWDCYTEAVKVRYECEYCGDKFPNKTAANRFCTRSCYHSALAEGLV